jgi:RNA polymerase sigma-70 factor (ECF subfamily)
LSEAIGLEAAVAHLVPRARSGDAAARDELLARCRDTVYRWALVQTGEVADAEDVTQEVLIRLHAALHRFEGRSRFSTWLYRITRNEALGLRRRLRGRLRLLGAAALEARVDDATAKDPLATVQDREAAALAEILLHELPPRQREIPHLADLEGCDQVEIATRLGISPSTVRVHLFHARRTLRSRILDRWPELATEGS